MIGPSISQTTITAQSPGVRQYLNPLHMVRALWRHRDLIRQFTRREIEGRYKGSFLGILWSFVNPLVLLLIYTFVFGIVFKSRWPNAKTDNLGEFAITLFCGLITFNVFSECVTRSPTMIVGVPNYVKKVVFPLEILAVSSLGAALFHGLISLLILLVASVIINGIPPWTLLLIPVVVLPLLFLCLGLSWFLSSLGLFVRDISYVVALVVQVLFFVTPIFYPLEAIPAPFQTVIRLNPLTSVVENMRRVVLWGWVPSWAGLGLWLVATGSVMLLGYTWFMKTKKAFADVI
ncbi:ABC transporter permease [Kouleothrix sp.]|mgnify:CR=1 FL=1|uniref:ABC transporter permease n=1 Tax=Kouleothrix sp. TaxID=2779161 RepID=UPI00391CF42C